MNDNLENRQIRIFISSTFQDMQEERDYLITKVFPRLQEEAARRDVSIIPLDLRWGITEEESKSGKVLQICLEEIENSRPFFIGLLGNRYGWCPAKEELDKNEILKERWGYWLEEDFKKGLSVTEIEMQYGVLRAQYDLNAFFYIKKEEDPRADNLEKLKNLKTVVRENKRYPVNDYDTPEDLGQQVEDAFMGLLNKLFPKNSLSEMEKEKDAQKVFTKSRTEVYVPNDGYMKAIDDFLLNPDQRNFVVVGESGIGKSALLANWSEKIKDKEWKVLYYPIGNRKRDCNYLDLLAIIFKEVCDILHLQCKKDIDKEKKANRIISQMVSLVGTHKILIIWDGINQLVADKNAKSLYWLPVYFSNNIKNIYSTIPDDETMVIFNQRHYPQLKLTLLKENEREKITKKYLWHLRKNLTDEQTMRIVKDSNNSNTIVLKTMLNELVNFGRHDEIDEYIDYFLKATTTIDFFNLVIKRFETSYGAELVRTCLSSLAYSYYGLSEAELLEISNARPLDWSYFYCVLKPHIIIKNGLLSFSHQVFKDAVICSYKDSKVATQQKLSDYFETKITTRKESHLSENYIIASHYSNELEFYDEETDSGVLFYEGENTPAVVNYSNNRVVPNRTYDELPYLYEALKEYEKLYKLLLDFGAFIYLSSKNEQMLFRFWHTLETKENGKYNLSGFLLLPYKPKREFAVYFINIAQFVNEHFTHKELVMSLYMRALEIEEHEQESQQREIPISVEIYSSIAQYYLGIEQYDKAFDLFKKALRISISENGECSTETASCYNYLGIILHEKNNSKSALDYYKKALRCYLAAPNHDDIALLANIYSNLALMNDTLHNYKIAIDFHKKAIDLRLKDGLKSNIDLAMSYNGLAYTYDSVKEYRKAVKNYMCAIKILTDSCIIEKSELAVVYENLGITYCNLKQWSLAHDYVQKAHDIYSAVYGKEHHQTKACEQLLYDIMMVLAQRATDKIDTFKIITKSKK